MADDVEWDSRKAAANLKKHGVDFADAATVLYEDRAVTIRADEAGEERYVTIGMDATGRILVVIYTWRGARARLISARRRRKSANNTRQTHETTLQLHWWKARRRAQDVAWEDAHHHSSRR